MQFFLLKPAVAILAFSLGIIGVLYLAPLATIPPVLPDAPVEVTVAELAQNPQNYHGKLVNLRGRLHLMERGPVDTVSDDGSGPDWLWVTCKEGYKSCAGLIEDIRDARPKKVEIAFTGRFFASPVEREGRIQGHFGRVAIIETRGLEIKGVRLGTDHRDAASGEIRYVDQCENRMRDVDECGGGGSGGRDADPVQDKVRGKGRGTGHGSGNGTRPGGSLPGPGGGGG